MRRLHGLHGPRRLAQPPPLVWLLGLSALGALGVRWSATAPAGPPPPPPGPAPSLQPPQQPASAAPAPRHVTRSLSELGLGPRGPGTAGLSDFALVLARIPQAGAELLALLLRRLQAANGFRLLQLPLPPPQQGRPLSPTEQEELVAHATEVLRREALPVAFHGDLYFTNFSTFDRQSPAFVSLVRDPVERAVAGFHHTSVRRKRRRATAGGNGLGVDGDVLEALERCLALARLGPTQAECSWARPQAPYFCGHDSRCRSDSEWALRQAKANIDHYFPVVGVLEELNATMVVLQKRLPLFFSDLRDTYHHQLHEPHTNWNKKKDFSLRPLAHKKIRKRLALEYELYLWAKQRLMMQHFEDSQKSPTPDEAGQDRIAHTIHKRAQSESD